MVYFLNAVVIWNCLSAFEFIVSLSLTHYFTLPTLSCCQSIFLVELLRSLKKELVDHSSVSCQLKRGKKCNTFSNYDNYLTPSHYSTCCYTFSFVLLCCVLLIIFCFSRCWVITLTSIMGLLLSFLHQWLPSFPPALFIQGIVEYSTNNMVILFLLFKKQNSVQTKSSCCR